MFFTLSNRIRVLVFVLVLFLLSTSAMGDSILLETDFSELPDNWYNDAFTLSGSGAILYYVSLGHLSAKLQTGSSDDWEQNIFIPDGIDSVRIEIIHDLYVSGGEYPTLTFNIKLGNLYTEEYLWYQYINYEQPNFNQTLTHTICPDWLNGGDLLGIRFYVHGWPGEYGSIVDWKITYLKVTAFGDDLAFTQNTWAGIKASL